MNPATPTPPSSLSPFPPAGPIDLSQNPEMKSMLEIAQQTNAAVAAAVANGFPMASPDGEKPAPEFLGNGQPARPGDDRITPEELQSLREMIAKEAARKKAENYELPKIEVTDDDRQRFYDSVAERKPFSEKMIIIEGKLEVQFRCKTRKEVDQVERQLLADLNDSHVRSERAYATAKINYSLMMQIVAINGIAASHPSAYAADPQFSLRTFLDSHIISTLPEWTMFMLSGALTQFDLRCELISKECLSRNFPQPVGL